VVRSEPPLLASVGQLSRSDGSVHIRSVVARWWASIIAGWRAPAEGQQPQRTETIDELARPRIAPHTHPAQITHCDVEQGSKVPES
jgi:hypothetical protein